MRILFFNPLQQRQLICVVIHDLSLIHRNVTPSVSLQQVSMTRTKRFYFLMQRLSGHRAQKLADGALSQRFRRFAKLKRHTFQLLRHCTA